ncbi:hypothetical protein [Thermosynechococcus sp.]|uniref:hypothetical protein n=1 Tax=Thermosynechococcus sp. TaxID=2814275 RepID=UPI00391CCC17
MHWIRGPFRIRIPRLGFDAEYGARLLYIVGSLPAGMVLPPVKDTQEFLPKWEATHPDHPVQHIPPKVTGTQAEPSRLAG